MMLLLLRRLHKNGMAYCALDKIRESTRAEKSYREQRLVCERKGFVQEQIC